MNKRSKRPAGCFYLIISLKRRDFQTEDGQFEFLKRAWRGVRECLLSNARQTSPRTSAGRGESETRLCAAPTRGNPRSEVSPPKAFNTLTTPLPHHRHRFLNRPVPGLKNLHQRSGGAKFCGQRDGIVSCSLATVNECCQQPPLEVEVADFHHAG